MWSPENQEKVQALHNLASDLGVSLTNMSLAWCLKNPNVSSVILGATKTHQLEENLKSLEVLPKLTTELMEKIDEVMGNKPSLHRF